jgi:hypothetical protein
MSARTNKAIVRDDKFQSVLMNSIAWELYNDDGREVVTYDDGNAMITVSEVELDRCRGAVKRVLGDFARGK